MRAVDPSWFGTAPLLSVDSKNACDQATAFCFGNSIYKMIIPPGRYHLSDPWKISHSSGNVNYLPIVIEGYGAILDNTVIVSIASVSLQGLAVDGAPQHGFVFLRGQGAYHQHLLATGCGLDGFYFGIDSGEGDYGFNFQVTRSTFIGLMSLRNQRHGWHMEGESIANRSWFNANSIIGLSLVANQEKGLHISPGVGPNGNSQYNYNTFMNINAEGNDAISIDMPEGRANTFLGGHYVDRDEDGFAIRTQGPFNMHFGGRIVGEIEHSSFVYANSAVTGQSGIVANIKGVDSLTTKYLNANDLVADNSYSNNFVATDMTVEQEPFIPKGWSVFPHTLHSFSGAGDKQSNHKLELDIIFLASTDDCMFRMTRFGKRNSNGGNVQKYVFNILIHVTTDVDGNISVDWNRKSEDQNCMINSVTVIGTQLEIDFNTDMPIFTEGSGVTEYQNLKNTDFR